MARMGERVMNGSETNRKTKQQERMGATEERRGD